MSLAFRRYYAFLRLCAVVLIAIAFMACNKGGRYEDDDDGDDPTPGFSLSGSITVAENAAVDSDTNDEGATTSDNDNFGQAQELPVPVVLGGYVNRSDTGSAGNSYDSGDPSDFYRLTFGSGQTISLRFSNYPTSEIHLYLYDSERRLVDSSKSSSNTQSLTIATEGTYYLEVFAETGADNYTLAVNLAEISASVPENTDLQLSADFVTGEAIVEMMDSEAETNAYLATTLAPMGLKADGDQGPQLLRFEVGGSDGSQLRSLGGNPEDIHRGRIDPSDHELLAKWDTLEMIRQLRAQVWVRGADLNYRRYAMGITPDDTHFNKQWHYNLINLPNAWEQTTGSADVLVAVIDTGVLLDHPDLQGKLVAGYDFISDEANANDGDGRDADPDDPGDSLEKNSSFHGTHVAGTIAALSDNGVGVAGAGWQTRVMPLRILGVGGGTSYDLIQALRYAAGLSNASGNRPDQAADIINLSLGGGSYAATEQAAITAARDAGVIIVAAAGNSGDETTHYPASYEGVVSVSAVDSQAELASYSSYGASVDVAAPGGNTGADLDGDGYADGVLSTCGEEAAGSDAINMVYCYYQGTSMAAPHVAAVAALMKAVDPDMTPSEFDARLVSGLLTRDLGDEDWDDAFGHGLIDAYQSVLSAMEDAPTVALFEPATLTFGRTDEALNLNVSRLGEDELSIVSVNSDASWLQATGDDLDSAGFGTYRVLVDRTGLADAIYRAHLSFETSTETHTIAVQMQVLAETTPGELANHYALLIDSASNEAVGQAQATAAGAFSIDGVSAGSYYLIAGSDMDNDNYIGDAGEAFGAYLSLDNPILLEISGSRSNLDIVTSYRLALPGSLTSGQPGQVGYPVSKSGLVRWR